MSNYYDTFIQAAADSLASAGTIPPIKGDKKTVAVVQYELLSEQPYTYTQEEVLFETHLRHKGLTPEEAERGRLWEEFFAVPKACLRASSLPKTYGWGVHFDAEGKAALCGVETERYSELSVHSAKTLKAMRSKRT